MVTTINNAYLDARMALRAGGVSGSDIEARELICKALKIDARTFIRKRDDLLFDGDIEAIDDLVELRLSGVPLQHITGHWEFYGLEFKVTPETLIPRADTETLVDQALSFLNTREKGRALDLCCGTGCIGIALARYAKNPIKVILGDISPQVLRVAKENVILNRVSSSVSVAYCDASQVCPGAFGQFDLVCCNPPYIPTAEIDFLDDEVRREPRLALDGGPDGLRFYREVSVNYKPAIREGGALMFEVGAGETESVREILVGNGYEDISVFKDLTGIERVVCGCVPYSLSISCESPLSEIK